MAPDELSEEGQYWYDEHGFSESTIPFTHEEFTQREKERGMPFYFTFDYVLDEALREEYIELNDDVEFFTRAMFEELLERGFIFEVYDAEPVLEDLDDFKNNFDKISFLVD